MPAATPPSSTAGPPKGIHALQIEINRAIYLDEAALQLGPGFDRLKSDLDRLFRALTQTWSKAL